MKQLADPEDLATGSETVQLGVKAPCDERELEAENALEPWIIDGSEVMRATRLWIQYGLVGFTIFCILIGAVEALFGR